MLKQSPLRWRIDCCDEMWRYATVCGKHMMAQQIWVEAEVQLQPEYLQRIPAPCTFTAVTTVLIRLCMIVWRKAKLSAIRWRPLLCRTLWTVRTKAISAVLHNYEALYSTLLRIAKECSKFNVRDTASGMARQLKTFFTYFGLSFAQNIFSVCEKVASTLQKSSITAQTSVTCVNSLKTNLQRQRDVFHLFYDQVVTSSKAVNFGDDPKLSRPKQVQRWFQQGDGEQHHFLPVKEFHRAQCVEAIDACLTALQERTFR